MKRRVLIVENGAGFGGALTSLASLLSGLDAADWDVHCLTAYPQDHIRPGGAVGQVGVLPRQRRYGPVSALEPALRPIFGRRAGNAAFAVDHLTTGRTYAKAVAGYIRRHGINLVVGNNGVLINDAVILGAGRAGVPCLIHARGPEYPGRLTGWLARRTAGIMAVSGYVADTVRKAGVPDRRIALLPEGLDADGFAAGADPEAFRARHDLPQDLPLVGLVACLAGWKGHDIFLDACAAALPEVGAGAVLVGGDPGGAVTRLVVLRERVRALGLSGRVWCVGHEADVASAMAACAVVVHASTSPEPFGRVLLEAMALGRPVVATDDGGPREVVTPDVDGLLVPPSDAPALARAMIRLLGDEDLRQRLGRAGWRKVREHYGIAGHVARATAEWARHGAS